MITLNNLTSLVHVYISFYEGKTVDLNFNDERNKFENFEMLDMERAKNVVGSFSSLLNLKSIFLNLLQIRNF